MMSNIEEDIQKAQEERDEEKRKQRQLLDQLESEKAEQNSKLQLALTARDAALAESQRVVQEVCELQQQLESTKAALHDQVPWNDIQLVLDQAHGDLVSTTTRLWNMVDALQNRRLGSFTQTGPSREVWLLRATISLSVSPNRLSRFLISRSPLRLTNMDL
jgi:predicted nuclease with TOPRIM domain